MTDNPAIDNLPATDIDINELMRQSAEQAKPIGQQINKWALKLRSLGVPPEAFVDNLTTKPRKIDLNYSALDPITGKVIYERKPYTPPTPEEQVKRFKETGLYEKVEIRPDLAFAWSDARSVQEQGLVAIVRIPKKQTSSKD